MAGPAEEAGRRGCGDRSRDDGGVAAMGQRSIGGRARGETEGEDRRLIRCGGEGTGARGGEGEIGRAHV